MKLTDAHRALICARRAQGLSLRAIASWLASAEGVSVSAQAVKDVLDRAKAGATSTSKMLIGESKFNGLPVDFEQIRAKVIGDLDADIATARASGNEPGRLALERIRADVVAQEARRAAADQEAARRARATLARNKTRAAILALAKFAGATTEVARLAAAALDALEGVS